MRKPRINLELTQRKTKDKPSLMKRKKQRCFLIFQNSKYKYVYFFESELCHIG